MLARFPVRPLLLAALALAGLALAAPASADGLRWRACADVSGFQCAVLRVPLDRTGRLRGTIALHVARQSRAPRHGGVLVALSGGPGQSSIGAAPEMAAGLRPAWGHYRIYVVDQRGTGLSGVLRCPQLQRESTLNASSSAAATARCAAELGAARDQYSTVASADDLEALRRAIGAPKLALQGISYGTYTAVQYARLFPSHVDRLVLDSIVGPHGVDRFLLDTYSVLPRILGEICAARACAGITSNPVGDLRALAARIERAPLRGTVVDMHGRRRRVSLSAGGLIGILFAGDLDPHVRAALPAAIRAALDGDAAPMLRLVHPAAGPPLGVGDLSAGLNVATTCDDTLLDYSLSTPIADRSADIQRALAAVPDADLGPFDRTLVEQTSVDEQCRLWPEAQVPPPASGPLPDVPALLLSGRQDMRTPLENAEGVAAELPHAQLVPVPGTGHDETDSDLSGCVQRALSLFFANRPVGDPCARVNNGVPPQPLAPTSLGRLAPAPGSHGDRGRVLRAAVDTLDDVREAFEENADAGFLAVAGGGLRAGTWRLDATGAFTLRNVVWCPKVRVSGRVVSNAGRYSGTLRVSAPHGLGGRLRFDARRGVSGVLGGRRVHLAARFARGALERSLVGRV